MDAFVNFTLKSLVLSQGHRGLMTLILPAFPYRIQVRPHCIAAVPQGEREVHPNLQGSFLQGPFLQCYQIPQTPYRVREH
jgi:hypothetical protein